jgi:GT2 family glycosyltransferase
MPVKIDMMNNKLFVGDHRVSIIIPVIRPLKARRCIEAIRKNAGVPDDGYEIIAEQDAERIGCPAMVKSLVEHAHHDLVMFLGDDTIPGEDFLLHALYAMASLPEGWGLVALNDGVHEGRFATHWLADKRLLPHLENREFFNTAYRHCFCDRELTDIARELGRYCYAEKAAIQHDHPHVTGEEYDEGYKAAYKMETFLADQATYRRRKIARNVARSGMKLAVALPVVNDWIHSPFFLSFLLMDKPPFTLFVPEDYISAFGGDIAKARNALVEHALNEGCSHILMMDTDQIYPADTVRRLLSHDKDITGAVVHKRYPPFNPILLRGTLGRYLRVSDEETYSGKLVEVDATGTGCLLIKSDVFFDIEFPWFCSSTKTDEGKPVGEDIYFCSEARKAGRRIYVDTGVQIGHMAHVEINRRFYEIFKNYQ